MLGMNKNKDTKNTSNMTKDSKNSKDTKENNNNNTNNMDGKIKKTTKTKLKAFLVVIATIIFFFNAYVYVRGEYLIHLEAGTMYSSVFRVKMLEQLAIFTISSVITYIVIYLITKKIQTNIQELYDEEKRKVKFSFPTKSIAYILALVVGLITTIVFKGDILKLINITWFGKRDAIFSLDYSFYIFILPIIEKFITYIILVTALITLYVVFYDILVVNIKLRWYRFKEI